MCHANTERRKKINNETNRTAKIKKKKTELSKKRKLTNTWKYRKHTSNDQRSKRKLKRVSQTDEKIS